MFSIIFVKNQKISLVWISERPRKEIEESVIVVYCAYFSRIFHAGFLLAVFVLKTFVYFV